MRASKLPAWAREQEGPRGQLYSILAADLTGYLETLAKNRKANPVTYTLGEREFHKFDEPTVLLHPNRPAFVMAYQGRDNGGFVLTWERATEYLGRLKRGFTGRHDE